MRRAVLGCLALLGVLAMMVTTVSPAQAATPLQSTQYRLNQFGCDAGPMNGVPNDHTKYAIVRFQAANKLVQSGRLTDITKAKLLKADAIHCDKRPVPTNTGTGKRIVMSQKQNWVWLVRADGSTAWQGGIIDNPSVVKPGVHTVGVKCGRAAKILHNRNYDKDLILDYFSRFVACGVGFHRVPTYVTNPSRQIHPDWMLGTNAMTSGGCVRVSNTTAQKIWYFAPSGTKVVVVADR